jgi:hypothetical protein
MIETLIGQLGHYQPFVRVSAAESLGLFLVVFPDPMVGVLSRLVERVLGGEAEDPLASGVFLAIRAIYSSSLMAELPHDSLVSILYEQVGHFYFILENLQMLTPRFAGEVVLTITTLIPNAIWFFREDEPQLPLLDIIDVLLGAAPDLDFCAIMYQLLRAEVDAFYADDKGFPVLNRIMDHALFDLDVSELQSLSLQFWNHLISLEVTNARYNCQVRNYNAGLLAGCFPQAIKNVPEPSPLSERPFRGCFRYLMDYGIESLIRLHCNTTRGDDDTSTADPLLRNLIALEPGGVFSALCGFLPGLSDSCMDRDFLLCLELLSIYGESNAELDDVLGQNVGRVHELAMKPGPLQPLAVSVLEGLIRLNQTLETESLVDVVPSLCGLLCPDLRVLPRVISCLAAVFECFSARKPDIDLLSILDPLTDAILSLLPRVADAVVVGSAFALLELLVSLLPDSASSDVISYFDRVPVRLILDCDQQLPPHIRLAVTEASLSLISLLFQVHGRWLAGCAFSLIELLLQGAEVQVGAIPVCEDLHAALVGAFEAMCGFDADPQPAFDMLCNLWVFIKRVMDTPSASTVADICPLLACAVGRLPAEAFSEVPQLFDIVCMALDHPSCLPQTRPKLLNGLASVLRAWSREPKPLELHEHISAQGGEVYIRAFQTVTTPDHGMDVSDLNRMYESIYGLLGALIYAYRTAHEWLEANQDLWVPLVQHFVHEFLLNADEGTLRAYTSFLGEAVQHLPRGCWNDLAPIEVRQPLILALRLNDPRNPIQEVLDAMAGPEA